jgi:hypothetical protein
MADTNISEAMRAVIGQEYGRSTSFPVSPSDIRKWAIAVYHPAPPPAIFWDEKAAQSGPYGELVAPEDFNPFAWMTADGPQTDTGGDPNDPDNTEKTVGIEGPGLKYQLNGGMEVEYGAPIRPGDVITSVSNIASYTEREGRLGLMLFTVMENIWTNQDDELARRSRLTLIRY